ncbi:hypothetical protein MTO96_034911 [Rhipicephalus appendiculatus]
MPPINEMRFCRSARDRQDPAVHRERRDPPGYCEMCNYANADLLHMLRLNTVQQNTKGPSK